MKRIKVSVYEDNGWTKIGENSGLALMIIERGLTSRGYP